MRSPGILHAILLLLAIWVCAQLIVVQKDTAIMMKELGSAQKERDAALEQRDSVLKERDTALKERDTALKERDSAQKDRGMHPVLSLLRRVCKGMNTFLLMEELVSTSPKGSIIIDVGLAHGKECFQVARAGRICRGFEADPHYASLLQQRVEDENIINAFVTKAAVGPKAGQVTFVHDGHNQFGVGGRLGSEAKRNDNEVVSVDMVTLDSQFPSSKKEQIFLLKTDTQGFELGVLQGAMNLIEERRVRFILLEMSIFLMPEKIAEAKQVMQILDAGGFFCVEMPWHTPDDQTCGSFVTSNKPFEWLDMLYSAHKKASGCFTDLLCELSN